MWLAVLGPLCVRDGDRDIMISAGKQRAVLAALLTRANRVVSFEELARAVWEHDPPPTARVTLRNYVKELRRLLGSEAQERILTRDPGYLARFGEDEVDILRFGALCRRGRALVRTGDWETTADVLAEALALWRGDPLADIPLSAAHGDTVAWLEQQRLQALEWRVDADLNLGRHGGLVPELRALTARHPLHERFHAQLMIAFCQGGRTAEALDAYESARSVLADKLGVDPGPELRRLHERVLRGEVKAPPAPAQGKTALRPAARPSERSSVAPSSVAPSSAALSSTVLPRQLPAAPGYFVGRESDLAALAKLLGEPDRGTPTCTIIGTAGVGKTALAIQFAHRVASQYPDGQLYVNLRGFDPVGPPTTPEEALTGFLTALGVEPQRVPATRDEQSALYRTLLADRKILVVLDNARDAGQVRPLLPGGTGCAVLVTSRDQLAGLAAREGAHPIVVDLLPARDARALLRRRLGAERAIAAPEAIDALMNLCARLPLALSVAAARAAAAPGVPLAALAASLRDARCRLDGLDTGDTASDVRAVLSWSLRDASDAVSRMFRLLGLHPGPEISVPAAASMAGVTVRAAATALRELRDAHLVAEPEPGRFGCHDLLRSYAAELAEESLAPAERREAVRRLLDYYLHAAYAADRLLSATRDPIALIAPLTTVPRADSRTAAPGTAEEALGWFRAERPVLTAAVSLAAGYGLGSHAWQLAWCLVTYLDRPGHWRDWEGSQLAALEAARLADDTAGQAHSERQLGRLRLQRGPYAEAEAHLLRAIDLFQAVGDDVAQARVLLDVAVACERQGRYADAIPSILRALGMFQAAGHLSGQSRAMNGAGWCLAHMGDYQQALSYCTRALALDRELGSRPAEQATLHSVGFVYERLGDLTAAIGCYEESLRLCADLGDRYGQADTLASLGDARQALGDDAGARTAWREALDILDDLEHPDADSVRARLDTTGTATAA